MVTETEQELQTFAVIPEFVCYFSVLIVRLFVSLYVFFSREYSTVWRKSGRQKSTYLHFHMSRKDVESHKRWKQSRIIHQEGKKRRKEQEKING